MNANMSPQAVHGGICVKHLTDAISRTIRITPRMMRTTLQWGPLSPPYRGMYKFVDLEGKWLSGAFSVLNSQVDRGIVAS